MVWYGLERLFRAEPDFSVLAICRTGDETLETIRELRPEIAILDVNLPGKSGLSVAKELQREIVPTRVILIAQQFADQEVIEAMRAGVRGMILSTMPPEIILRCAFKVANGERWLEMDSHARAFDALLQTNRPRTADEQKSPLSSRESEVARMVANGLGNREIARQLDVSESTVKVHVHNARRKLGAKSRVELALIARAKGLI
jgi:two-component system nitrate/nitrite response regulator NarL